MATKKTKKAKKPKLVYTLAQRSYEYNDEYSYTPEYGGSHVLAAYTKREKAEAELKRRTEIDYVNCDPSEYMPPGDDLSEDVVLALRDLGEPFLKVKSSDDLNGIWSTLSPADCIRAWKIIDGNYNSFYEIVETPVEG